MTTPRAYLLLMVLVALAARLALAAGQDVITNDGASYLRLADNLARTGQYFGIQGDLELKFPPGYPALIASVVLLGVSVEWSGYLVAALAGALLVLPAFAIGRRLGGAPTGWAAAILIAFSPPLVWASSLAIAEVVLALFATSALALLLGPGLLRAVAAGALLGGANLVKPEAFGFLLTGAVAAVVVNGRSRLGATAAFVAGFALVTGPWIAFLNAHVDPLLLEGKSGMYGHVCRRVGSGIPYGLAAAGLDADGRAGPLVRFNQSVGQFVYSQELFEAPRAFLGCWIHNAERIFDVTAREAYVHPIVAAAAAFGAARGFLAGGMTLRITALILLALGATIAHVLSGMVTMWIAPRYLLPALVLSTILAANGLTAWRSFVLPVQPGATIRAAGAWAALAIALAWWIPDLPLAFGEQLPITERDMHAPIVADANGRRPRVMSRFAVTSFYADGDWIQLPVGDARAVIRYARSQGVTHLAGAASVPLLTEIGGNPDDFGLRVVAPSSSDDMVVFALDRTDQASVR